MNQSKITNGPEKSEEAKETVIDKIEVVVANNSADSEPPGQGALKLRNKVKLFQTKKMMSKILGEGGVERSTERKLRVETNLGITIGNNLN